MKELEKEKYNILTEPLKELKINTLFARSVIEHKIAGKVFTDTGLEPTTFYVVHPYGMSLLFGRSDNKAFNRSFADYALNINHERHSYVWMQAYPPAWDSILNELFGDKLIKSENNFSNDKEDIIELNTRVNFKFNLSSYFSFKKEHLLENPNIVRSDKTVFREMNGSVIPSKFWDNADAFTNDGVGFSFFHQGKLAATAFSAFIFENCLELGLETISEFRGKGFAQYVCTALIDYCIENSLEPIWACKFENTPSYQLAQKLGFEPSVLLPYYRLNN